MTLKAVVKSLDGVPETLHEFYKKGDDGRFYIDAEGVDDLPSVIGLKTSRDNALREKKATQDKLASFEGVDPEAHRKLVAEAEKARKDGLMAKGDVAELTKAHEAELAQVRDKAAKEVEAAKENGEKESGAAQRYFRAAEITAAVSAEKGSPDLLGHVIEQVTKVELSEDGDFRLVVLDESGSPRIKDSGGTPFTLGDLVTEMKSQDRYGRAFDASGSSGSGSEQGSVKERGANGVRTLKNPSPVEFGRNVEAIAKGEITVT